MSGKRPSRQIRYYHRKRAELFQLLGPVCVHCGETCIDKLEFDHIHGSYAARALSSSARIARYAREISQGLIQVLCADCNKAKRKMKDGKFIPEFQQYPPP